MGRCEGVPSDESEFLIFVLFWLSRGGELDGYRKQHKLTQIPGKCDQPRYPGANHQRASQQLLLTCVLREHETGT